VNEAPGWSPDQSDRDELSLNGHVWPDGLALVGAAGAPDAGSAGGTVPETEVPAGVPARSLDAAAWPPPPWPPTQPDTMTTAPFVVPNPWSPPSAAAPPPPPARRGRRRRVVLGSIAAGVLVLGALAGAGAFVVGRHGDAAASEAITTAASTTLAAQSADMSMTLHIAGLGHDESITGHGAFDFANQSGTFSVNLPGDAGKQVTEQVIYDGKTVYVNVGNLLGNLGGLGGLGGLPNGLIQGKQWVSIDTSQFGSGNAGALGGGLDTFGNPAAMLHQLQSEGGTVTSLGSTTYDGTAVTEYSVSLPPSDIEKGLGQLPSSVRQGLSSVMPPSIEAKVYVAAGNLLKAIDLPISYSVMGHTVSEDMTMVFSNFGTPVSVTPPPANEVIPFSQFAGGVLGGSGLGNSGNSGNTGSGPSGNSGNTGNSGNSGTGSGLFGNSGNSGDIWSWLFGGSGNTANTGNTGSNSSI
jgi:hypothetical protein